MTTNTTNEFETATVDTFMEEVKTYLKFKIASYLANYWAPILVPIGLIGNTLSFLVMIKPNNRKMSTCIYMAAISINDNVMMILFLYTWLTTAMRVYIMNSIECKLLAFFVLLILQNSTYQVLAMTIDKYVAIKWPHKAATYSTPKGARRTAIVIFICVFIYNIPHLFLSNLVGKECLGYAVSGILTKVYAWSSFTLNGLIPFAMLIYMNFVIVKTVRSSRKMFGGNDSLENSNTKVPIKSQINTVTVRRENKMKNTENQLTKMLLLVSILFLILLLPTYMRFVYTNFATRDTPSKYASLMLFYHVSHKLYFTNNGINFFLYCVSGQKFRNDLKEILCCGKASGSTKETSTTVTDVSVV